MGHGNRKTPGCMLLNALLALSTRVVFTRGGMKACTASLNSREQKATECDGVSERKERTEACRLLMDVWKVQQAQGVVQAKVEEVSNT